MRIKTRKEWTTHIPMLLKTVQLTQGPIAELGAGVYSTPLLHWLCAESRRPLVTYEQNEEYYLYAKKFVSRNHRVKLIKDWRTIDTKTHWSVVFVDQDAASRAETAILLKNSADYIILHDSDQERLYRYDTVYPHFENIYHWKFCKPYTTVVSNTKSLMELINNA